MKAVKRFFTGVILISAVAFALAVFAIARPERRAPVTAAPAVPAETVFTGEGTVPEGAAFDETKNIYYSMLPETGKALYSQAYMAAVSLTGEFVPSVTVYENEMVEAMNALFLDHPELFYVDTSYQYAVYDDGRCVKVMLEFNGTVDDIQSSIRLFDGEVNAIIEKAKEYGSDYEREKYVHDTLIDRISYLESSDINQSAYSAIVNRSTVCAGYSKAFQIIMNELGITTYLCIGQAEGDHVWNIVRLDDGYYNVDLTFDDQGYIIYNFFNRTDDDLSLTHERTGLSLKLPACNAQYYRGLEKTNTITIYFPGTDKKITIS